MSCERCAAAAAALDKQAWAEYARGNTAVAGALWDAALRFGEQ